MTRTTVTIRQGTGSDAETLAPLLRQTDVTEIAASHGHTPRVALLRGLEVSTWCNALEINGAVSALFGVSPFAQEGADHRDVGIPWLLGASNFYKLPSIKICRMAIEWVDVMHETYPHLVNWVDCRNTKPIQWLSWLGFQFTAMHPLYGVGKMPFLQFERRIK